MTLPTIILIAIFSGACGFAGFIFGMWYVIEFRIDHEIEERRCCKTRMIRKVNGNHVPETINHYKIDDMYIDANLN